jgi:hypothetical protein
MRKFLPKSSDWFLLGVATIVVLWPQMIIPLRGYGAISFASAFREVRIGMTWDEWQQLQRRHGVECVCDATDCYVDDLLRTYEVTFRSGEGGPLRVYSKRAYFDFPIRPSWKLLHR